MLDRQRNNSTRLFVQQSQLSREGDLLTRERLCCGLSLFSVVLRRLKAVLSAPAWPAPPSSQHTYIHTDDTAEFHRSLSLHQLLLSIGDIPIAPNQLF